MIKVAVFGASGFGREVLPLVRQQLQNGKDQVELVFVDDHPVVNELNGQRVLTYSQWMAEPASSRFVSIAIANSKVRRLLAKRCEDDGVQFLDVRSAHTVIMDRVITGEGSILCPFVTLTSNIRIGKHFHANIGSYVAHDCVIGDFVTFAPGVKCNGSVVVEDHAYIGTGAVLKQGIHGEPLLIGRDAVIGMGAVVTKNVSAGETVVGNPARPMIK